MLPSPERAWLYHAPIDLRKSYLSLAAVVSQELSCDVKSGAGFVFVNRRKTLAKVLWWDRTGWCLLVKRLSVGRYRISERAEVSELKYLIARSFFDGL